MHLAQRVLERLESLSTNLRIHTPRQKNLIQSNAPDGPVISLLTDHISLPASGQTLEVRLPGSCPDQPPEPPRMAGGDVVEIDLSGFPDDLRPGLYRHLAHLLRIERTHSLRQAIARGISPTSVELRSLIGKPPSYITSDGSGLAGHRLTLTNGESERGRLGVGVMPPYCGGDSTLVMAGSQHDRLLFNVYCNVQSQCEVMILTLHWCRYYESPSFCPRSTLCDDFF